MSFDINPYLAALNAAYTMLGYSDGYSGKIGTLETPTKGFMVAIKEIASYSYLSDVNVGEMWPKLEKICADTEIQDLYIGSFKDPDTKIIYFEVSVNLFDFDTAISWAKKNNQKYIYDVVNNCNILVND
jgi:hypothetical protein